MGDVSGLLMGGIIVRGRKAEGKMGEGESQKDSCPVGLTLFRRSENDRSDTVPTRKPAT